MKDPIETELTTLLDDEPDSTTELLLDFAELLDFGATLDEDDLATPLLNAMELLDFTLLLDFGVMPEEEDDIDPGERVWEYADENDEGETEVTPVDPDAPPKWMEKGATAMAAEKSLMRTSVGENVVDKTFQDAAVVELHGETSMD